MQGTKSIFDSLTNRQVTVIAAILSGLISAVIAAVVSIFTTRYTLKHGPNYEEQIDGLNEKFEGFHQTMGQLVRKRTVFPSGESGALGLMIAVWFRRRKLSPNGEFAGGDRFQRSVRLCS